MNSLVIPTDTMRLRIDAHKHTCVILRVDITRTWTPELIVSMIREETHPPTLSMNHQVLAFPKMWRHAHMII